MRPKPAKDRSAIESLARRVRDYLHMPDPSIMYAVLGTVAANMMQGEPVWLMLVGPPGSGKSEWLGSVLRVPNMHETRSISGESAFLSATAERDRSEKASGGLLRKVGSHGGLVINDFTTILSMREDDFKKVMSAIRETYSGDWTRDVGSEGGLTLSWHGKIAYLAGCTGTVDQHHAATAILGERWLYYRMEESDGFQRAMQLIRNTRKPEWKDDFMALIAGFLDGQDLRFGVPIERRSLTDVEAVRVIDMAEVAVKCRSAVARDRYTKEVIGAKETELVTRMSGALTQLLVGLDVIGVTEYDRWKLLGRIALDSMPKLRQLVVMAAWREPGGVTLAELKRVMGTSLPTIGRTVEDLAIHGVVHLDQSGTDKSRVHLTDWARTQLKVGWRDLGL